MVLNPRDRSPEVEAGKAGYAATLGLPRCQELKGSGGRGLPLPPPSPAARGMPLLRGRLAAFLERREAKAQRLFETLPGITSWLLVTSPVWGFLLLPKLFIYLVLLFDLYWLYRSLQVAYYGLLGYRRVQSWARRDWYGEYQRARGEGRVGIPWEAIHHLVIIPNFEEKIEKLRKTLECIARQPLAHHQITVVLAMEAREKGAQEKAERLHREFRSRFAHFYSTLHPANLEGEVKGKSSNLAWAARWAKRRLVDELGYPLQNITTTICDADSLLHPNFMACFSYHFATDPLRHRRFWQTPILQYNNIRLVPAPIRVTSSLSSVIFLADMANPLKTLFAYSTYSLSLQMVDEVGYWDPDVIPEDWHMFLKCFFAFQAKVSIERVYLPTNSDAVRASSYLRSLVSRYLQARRHAWGASDIPYALKELIKGQEVPWSKGLGRFWTLMEHHLLWTSHWFLLTLGSAMLPLLMLHPALAPLAESAFYLARLALALCLIPLLVIIALDEKLKPPRRGPLRPWRLPFLYLHWLLMPITSLFFASLPALEAHTRLMLGRYLEYQVTEKV